MSTIKSRIVDADTLTPIGYGVSAIIVKASDQKAEQIGTGFISDDNSVLEINSSLIDYEKNADAVDILIETNGYLSQRVSPEEFSLGDIKLKKKKGIIQKTKATLTTVPSWAWETGGWVLGAAILITIIYKKVK